MRRFQRNGGICMSLINLNEKPGIDLYEVNFKFKMSDEEILEVGRITRKASLIN